MAIHSLDFERSLGIRNLYKNKFKNWLFILSLALFCTLSSSLSAQSDSSRILYLIQNGQLRAAFDLYEALHQKNEKENPELLEQIGLALLDLGWNSPDPESKLLSLFGAGASGNERAQPLLEQAAERGQPEHQLVALNLLSRFHNARSIKVIERASFSPYLLIRLEAVSLLAEKQSPKACPQITSLLHKVPPEALPFFPHLLAQTGDREAILQLKRLMSHPLLAVRIETLLSAAAFHRDDLLPEIRILASHHRAEEQEAASLALGVLKDETSIERLQNLVRSPVSSVKLAACRALCLMGREKWKEEVMQEASSGNLFAIALLGELPETDSLLANLASHPERNIQINACLSLLEKGDPRCLPGLLPMLVQDARDLGWSRINSSGKTLHAWKAIPSAQQQEKNAPQILELTARFREETIQKMLKLPEKDTLKAAQLLLEKNESNLIHPLVSLLESLRTKKAIALLKYYGEQPGSPLMRSWCHLALYRLKEEGPYGDQLKNWIDRFHSHHLIQFLPISSQKKEKSGALLYQLTPEETSRLLIESLEALVQNQDEGAAKLLLHAIRNGHEKNRYALAGLLIHAVH